MGLSIKQIRAASVLAMGGTDTAAIEAAGVARATFYKWVKLQTFTEAVHMFTEQETENRTKLAAAGGSQDDVAIAYQDEIWIKEQLRDLLEFKIGLTTGLLEQVEPDDISPRQLPQLVQGITQLIESFRTSNDRIAGLEHLISELSQIEKQRSQNVVKIASAGDASAA